MVLLLTCDIVPHRLNLRETNGKNPVTVLPRKIIQTGASGFDPQRGAALDLLDHPRRLAGTRQGAQKMNMVFDTTHDNGLALEIGQNSAEVTVQIPSQGSSRLATLG